MIDYNNFLIYPSHSSYIQNMWTIKMHKEQLTVFVAIGDWSGVSYARPVNI